MIVGIDVGGSTTDAVLLGTGELTVVTIETGDPLAAVAGALGKLLSTARVRLGDLEVIAVSGGGVQLQENHLFGVPVITVPEIEAIGVGGTTLTEKTESLVVSMGTGTALVSVRGEKIEHIGGTGVGGGTLLGLARHMLGVTRLETLEELAAQGDRSRVDLTVGDITGGSVGIVPASATASNFGKIRSDPTSADKALALMNMVAEVILTISLMAARACRQRTIVLTGKLTRIQPVCSRFTSVRVRSGPCFVVPPHAAYTTAIGAARVLQKRRRS